MTTAFTPTCLIGFDFVPTKAQEKKHEPARFEIGDPVKGLPASTLKTLQAHDPQVITAPDSDAEASSDG